MTLQSILATTDFSPRSEQAVERAAMLAQQHKAALHLLHVLPPISWQMFGRAFVEHPLVTEKQLYDAASKRLAETAQACSQRHAIPVQSQVETGWPHERIGEYARNNGIGLTVLGAHAGNLGPDMYIGSTVLRLLHGDALPVLVVQVAPRAPYRSLLAAIDFSDISSAALDLGMVLAPDAAVHAVHVYDILFEGKMRYAGVGDDVIGQYHAAAEKEAAQLMQDFVAEKSGQRHITPVVRDGYPARTILDEAGMLQADLIVMGKQGRSGLEKLILGSVTEGVLYGLDRDLLVVKEHAA
ncbi:MAG TPA: universal stress protein [Noviherbaspirillum sp.]|nr:universal stress protein [Noviherbaspirillum sp.]